MQHGLLNSSQMISTVGMCMFLIELIEVRVELNRVSHIIETVHTSLFTRETIKLILCDSQVPSSVMT